MNVTLGQYVKGNSFLHKLDPRVKIMSTIILMVAVFLLPANSLTNFYILLGFIGFLFLLLIASRINVLSVIKGLQPILLIGIFTFILQIIYPGDNPGYQIGDPINFSFSWINITVCALIVLIMIFTAKYLPLKMLYIIFMLCVAVLPFIFLPYESFSEYNLIIYSQGLLRGAFFFARLVLVIFITTMLTVSTSTTDINLGLEWILHPLSYIKIPVAEFSMMLSLTLRFIPTLTIEADKIMKAQASRGVDFNEGSFGSKIKQIITLLIPMFVVSISKAEDLANAMEARGYIIGAKRTSVNELKFRFKDLFASLFVLIILTGAILVRVIA